MAGDTTQPLSVDAAKERLRAAAREAGFRAWSHHHPWKFIALALGSGYLAARVPSVRTTMAWTLARTLLSLTNK